jgi:hypothetical protein
VTHSSGWLRVDDDGRMGVDTSLRLTTSSRIRCHTYDGDPPILSIYDGCIAVSLTVPSRKQVTAEDVEAARLLANEAARYATELAEVARRQSKEGAADRAA